MIYQDLGTVTPNYSDWISFPVSPSTGKGIFLLNFIIGDPNAKKEYLLLRAKFLEDFNPVSGAIIFPVLSENLIFEFDLIEYLKEMNFIIEARKRYSTLNSTWSINLLQVL